MKKLLVLLLLKMHFFNFANSAFRKCDCCEYCPGNPFQLACSGGDCRGCTCCSDCPVYHATLRSKDLDEEEQNITIDSEASAIAISFSSRNAEFSAAGGSEMQCTCCHLCPNPFGGGQMLRWGGRSRSSCDCCQLCH